MQKSIFFVAAATCACGSILGIGDLPLPPSDAGSDVTADVNVDAAPSDATVDDATKDVVTDAPLVCDAGLSACGVACVDLTKDLANCGSCDHACATLDAGTAGCVASACTLTVDEQAHKNWSTTAPGPYLAIWKDGTVLASSAGSETSSLVNPTNGTATSFSSGPDMEQRPTIYLPTTTTQSDGGPRTEVALYHYGAFDAYDQTAALVWSNSIHGCCGGGSTPFAVDPTLGQMFTGHTVTVFGLDQGGADTFYQYAGPDGMLSVTASWLYLTGADGYVYKFARSSLSTWTWQEPIGAATTVDTATSLALTSTQGIITVSPAAGLLTRFEPNGSTPWQINVVNPTMPILTSGGLVVLGEVNGETPSLCAHDESNGSSKWCTPVADVITDLFAGDDGVIYAAVANVAAVYGFDAASGTLRYTFSNVPYPVEMLLRDGHLYAYGSGQLTSFDVPAQHYDASSWPVRFHDNQRTNGTVSSLTY